MKTAQSLNDKLSDLADRDLNLKLDSFFNPLTNWAYDGLHCGKMDSIGKSMVEGGGYFNVTRDVWPPHLVTEARRALFEGMKRNHREVYIANFIAKVDQLQSQIESIQQEIQQ